MINPSKGSVFSQVIKGNERTSDHKLLFLSNRYYQFDKDVVREILGKKLTGRLRKDLDDVSEKTRVSLKSCRRQVNEEYCRCINMYNLYLNKDWISSRVSRVFQEFYLFPHNIYIWKKKNFFFTNVEGVRVKTP